jgi:hypothetical protein
VVDVASSRGDKSVEPEQQRDQRELGEVDQAEEPTSHHEGPTRSDTLKPPHPLRFLNFSL